MTSSSSRASRRPPSLNVWSTEEIRTLRSLAAQGVPPHRIALALGRSEFAVRNKAGMQGISLGISLKRARSAMDEAF